MIDGQEAVNFPNDITMNETKSTLKDGPWSSNLCALNSNLHALMAMLKDVNIIFNFRSEF
jgi:hypothetical protein